MYNKYITKQVRAFVLFILVFLKLSDFLSRIKAKTLSSIYYSPKGMHKDKKYFIILTPSGVLLKSTANNP